jgi:hypothetical protein
MDIRPEATAQKFVKTIFDRISILQRSKNDDRFRAEIVGLTAFYFCHEVIFFLCLLYHDVLYQ